MERRTNRNGSLELPVLGMGCWSFGGGDYWGKVDQSEVNKVVAAAIDCGITYFDTAEVYNEGRSEQSLGIALEGIQREKVLIGSKIAPSNCYPGVLSSHCEDSLHRLRTDYLDLYMIHWPVHPHAMRHFTGNESLIASPPVLNDIFDELTGLKAAGKIRHIGVSNFGKRWMEEIPQGFNVSVNQLPYNLLCRAIEIEILPYCVGSGTGVMTYMSLFQGILAGLYKNLEDVPSWQSRTRHFNSEFNELSRHGEPGFEVETRRAIREIVEQCEDTGFSMAEIAISWIIANPDITCALAGARSEGKVMQNMKASQTVLPDELVKKLNRITRTLKEKLGNHFDYFEGVDYDRTI